MADPTTPATPTAQTTTVVAQFPPLLTGMIFACMVGVAGLAVAFGVFLYFDLHAHAAPKPFDAALQKIGRAYGPTLAPTRGAAFEKLADDLDAGVPFSKAWGAAIHAIQEPYDQQVTPALSAIIPAGTPDGNVTAQQAKAMSAATRGLGMGLSGK